MSDPAVTYHGPSYAWLFGHLSIAVRQYLDGTINRRVLESVYRFVQDGADAGESAMEASNE